MFPGTMWLHRWTEVLKERGSKCEMLMLLCTMHGYALGSLPLLLLGVVPNRCVLGFKKCSDNWREGT